MTTENIISSNFEEPHRGRRGHDFWPAPDVLAAIPSLYGTESVKTRDKVVHLHYFDGGSDWWLVELNPEDRIAFGYVRLGAQPEGAEWGYVDLDELAQVYVAPWVIVERDLGWRPRPAGEVIPGL